MQKLPAARTPTPELSDDDTESFDSATRAPSPSLPMRSDGCDSTTQLLWRRSAALADLSTHDALRWDDDLRAARELLSLGAAFSCDASQCSDGCEM